MARVTVEDCLERVANRFALTVLAARRARELGESRGTPLVECDNKVGVTALREIGQGGVRYSEDVEESVRQFIAEQRQQLEQYGLSDRGFAMDAVSFSGSSDGDDDDAEDIDSDIEELPSDLTNVRPSRADTSSDGDDSGSTNAIDEISDSEDEDASGGETGEEDDDSPDDEVPGEILEAAGLDDEESDTDLGDIVDDDDDDDDAEKPDDDV